MSYTACTTEWGALCVKHNHGAHHCMEMEHHEGVCVCSCRAKYRTGPPLPPDEPPRKHEPVLGKFTPKY